MEITTPWKPFPHPLPFLLPFPRKGDLPPTSVGTRPRRNHASATLLRVPPLGETTNRLDYGKSYDSFFVLKSSSVNPLFSWTFS